MTTDKRDEGNACKECCGTGNIPWGFPGDSQPCGVCGGTGKSESKEGEGLWVCPKAKELGCDVNTEFHCKHKKPHKEIKDIASCRNNKMVCEKGIVLSCISYIPEVKQEVKVSQKEAIERAFKSLMSLSKEELQAEIEKHKDGDIAQALLHSGYFDKYPTPPAVEGVELKLLILIRDMFYCRDCETRHNQVRTGSSNYPCEDSCIEEKNFEISGDIMPAFLELIDEARKKAVEEFAEKILKYLDKWAVRGTFIAGDADVVGVDGLKDEILRLLK